MPGKKKVTNSKSKQGDQLVKQRLPLTKQQISTLNKIVLINSKERGGMENSFVANMAGVIIFRIIELFELFQTQLSKEQATEQATMIDDENFLMKIIYQLGPVLLSFVIYLYGKKCLDSCAPHGLITGNWGKKFFTEQDVALAYSDKEQAKDFIDKNANNNAFQNPVYNFISVVMISGPIFFPMSKVTYLRLPIAHLCFDIAWLMWSWFKNNILSLKQLIEQQRRVLNDFLESVRGIQILEDENSLNFGLRVTGESIQYGSIVISKKIFSKLLQHVIHQVKNGQEMVERGPIVWFLNACFTELEGHKIKEQLNKKLTEREQYEIKKRNNEGFLMNLMEASCGLTWYSYKANNLDQSFICASTRVVDSWTTQEKDDFLNILKKLVGDDFVALKGDRFVITKVPEKFESNTFLLVTKFLKEKVQRLSVLEKGKDTVEDSEVVEVVKDQIKTGQPQEQGNQTGSVVSNSMQGKLRYFTSFFSKLASKATINNNSIPTGNPMALPTKTQFQLDNESIIYDPTNNYKDTLTQTGKAIVPFFHQGKLIGWVLLVTEKLQKLPDQGKYLFDLIDDNHQQGGGHIDKLTNTSKYANNYQGAAFKMKFWIKGGTSGQYRGLFIKLPDKNSQGIYQLEIIEHLPYRYA